MLNVKNLVATPDRAPINNPSEGKLTKRANLDESVQNLLLLISLQLFSIGMNHFGLRGPLLLEVIIKQIFSTDVNMLSEKHAFHFLLFDAAAFR